MSINKNNYETYLIDYLDGKLSPVQVSEVLLFLEQNPGIKREFEELDSVKELEQAPVSFDASFLKKPAYPEIKEQYEHLLIGELEGDLSKAEQIDIGRARQLYPELNRDAALFAKTRVVAETIVFPYKNDLKKQVTVPLYRQSWLRIAAVLLLVGFTGVVWINFNTIETPDEQISMVVPEIKESGVAKPADKSNSENTKNKMQITGTEEPKSGNQYAQQVAVSKKASAVTERYTEPMLISLIAPASPRSPMNLNPEGLSFTDQYLRYIPAGNNDREDEYTDLRQLAIQQLGKHKEQLLGKNENGKTLTLLQAINKATGDNIKVDTNDNGKIKRFEIAGLGFEWSHSK